MMTSHLCEQCAAAKGLETAEGPTNFPLTDFLAQMGDAPEPSASSDATPGYPNGALVTPDGSALVVVEAHRQRVVTLPILADGS